VITGKPRWPNGTPSPWAGDPQPPPVWQVALAYPGRALSNAFLAYLFGGVISGILVWGTAWLLHSFLGVGMLASPKPMFIVWPFVSIPLWYGAMYAEIRGWVISDNSD
jgi:hypothetical protein